jgi:hypothetical protein
MSDYNFTYRNNNFSTEKAPECELYIKAGKSDISILIARMGELMAWKDKCSAGELANDYDLGRLFAAPFKQVVIGLAPEVLTLVPTTLFSPDNIGDYARFLDVAPLDKVFAATLDDDNQIVYKTDPAIADELAKRFDLTKNTVPADRGWLAAITKSKPSDYTIYADVTDDQVSLANFNGGKLRFYNSFKATDINDMLYYCVFVAERLELQPNSTSLLVSGHCAAGDFEQLGQFFISVKYNDLKTLEVPQGVPSHQIVSLAALA